MKIVDSMKKSLEKTLESPTSLSISNTITKSRVTLSYPKSPTKEEDEVEYGDSEI
jgi:hypothetical protein